MKNIILYLLFLLTFISCTETKVLHYEYNGTVVTRINDYPNDFFLYGKHNSLNDTINSTFIKSSFSGFNSNMDAYMIFKPNKTVEIIPLDAVFEKHGLEPLLNLKEFNHNIDFIKWEESTNSNFKNIVQLSDVLEFEKKRNIKSGSLVKVY